MTGGEAAAAAPTAAAPTAAAPAAGPPVASGRFLTTNQGVRISDNQNTLRAGTRGPSLLEDFAFREKIMHFDHERIPERAVHARGSGAHGVFRVYRSLSQYTTAAFLTDPSAATPVFVRFSTVNGSRGSADTARDARGFATKFYTSEGVFDLVGNNIPVFFIQDAIKFPDLVHSFKPEPHNEIPQASTAHDNFWDFISLTPESMHMVMWTMSDRAIPRSYRTMEGFGVHTFRLVNARGESTLVKWHWKPLLGISSLVWPEAHKLMGIDADYHRRDLWDAIATRNYPEYELALQLLPEAEADRAPFDVLDSTKIWPEELIPAQRVGRLTLNRNPDNFFEETEQSAFHIGHLVPGIDATEDPLFQGRLFSYLDTQLNRFGTPNFSQLPINQPRSAVNTFNQDGFMRYDNRPGKVNYEPNSLGDRPREANAAQGGFVSYAAPVSGRKVRSRAESFGDHYSQATLFFQSQTEREKKHIVMALQFELSKVQSTAVRQRMLGHLANIDARLVREVATALGMPVPSGRPNTAVGTSPALSEESLPRPSAKGRLVAILAADGVDGADVTAIKAAITKAKAASHVIAPHLGAITAAGGSEIAVNATFFNSESVQYDAVYVPSGGTSVAALRGNAEALHFVREAFKHYKPIGADGDGEGLLSAALGSRTGEAGVVVGRTASSTASAFVEALTAHRHWARSGAGDVPA
ncbi:catalase [Motilibacter sp. K478]|nr:catalase [Motilibacter aurantiacus]